MCTILEETWLILRFCYISDAPQCHPLVAVFQSHSLHPIFRNIYRYDYTHHIHTDTTLLTSITVSSFDPAWAQSAQLNSLT